MSGRQPDRWGHTGLEGLEPTGGAQTPLISGHEALEAECRIRCAQVVSRSSAEFEELACHLNAHDMKTNVVAPGVAASIAVEPGEGIEGAGFEFGAEHVASHGSYSAPLRPPVNAVQYRCQVPLKGPGPHRHLRTPGYAVVACIAALSLGCAGTASQGQAFSGTVPSAGSTIPTTTDLAATSTGPAAEAVRLPTVASADDAPSNADNILTTTSAGGQGPAPPAGPVLTRPDWLGSRVLATNDDGVAEAQPTPPELIDRRLPTIDTLAPPTQAVFESSIEPLAGDPLKRSTWTNECPVGVNELRYVQMTFWGFDGLAHRGELILNAAVVDDVVDVFRTLFEARFPIEEMRIVTQADVDAPPTGDGNNTTSFVCRAVVGGSRFSEHAFGLAVDVNPFQNPYLRGEVLLPELSTAYLDRSELRSGMIVEGGVVVEAFDAIGWGWGGRWQSLDDYHHFALNDR